MSELPEQYKIVKIELSKDRGDRIKTLKVAKMVLQLPRRELQAAGEQDRTFKKLVEDLLNRQEKICLEILKRELGMTRRKQSLFSRIYHKALFLLRWNKEEEQILKELAPHLREINLSLDLVIAENPNPILFLLPRYFPNLRRVNLNSCNVTKEGIEPLKKLEFLESISLSLSDHLLPEVLVEISTLKTLKELKLSWNRQLPLEVMELVCQLITLENLDLSHTNITDRELYFIAKLPHIEMLKLDSCSAITEDGVKALTSLTHLHYLSLQHCSNLSPKVMNLFSPDVEIKAA